MISINSEKYISIMKAVEYFQKNEEISITKCAHLFNIHRSTLSNKLLDLNIHQDRRSFECNKLYFKNIETDQQAYWLGFILADGCIKSKANQLSIRLAIKDVKHLEKFRKELNSKHKIYIENTKCKEKFYKIASLKINSKNLCDDLRYYGIESKKSTREYCTKNISNNLISSYIRGIFDGDGWFYINNNCCEVGFAMGYKALEYIKYNLETLANIKSYKIKSFKNIYRYRITSKIEIKKFFEFIYLDAEVYLDRKYKKYKDCRLE